MKYKRAINNGLSISVLLFLVLPFLQLLVDFEIYWSFPICIYFMILIEYKIFTKSKAHSYLWLLTFPLIWASLMSFNDNFYSIIKALYYLSTPLIFTFIGMQIAQIASPRMILKYVVYSGTTGALLYIALSFYTLGFKALEDPFEMRKLLMWGSITNVISIFVVSFSERYGVFLYKSKGVKFFLVVINLLGLYLTSSRTYYLIFIFFLMIFLWKKNKKTIIVIASMLFIGFNILLNLKTESTFVKKLTNGVKELKGGNYQTEEDINTMYRGYETFMALKAYQSGTVFNWFFGHGFEKEVDLQTYIKLAGNDYRKIPILHNGYVFQLLREGLLGLALMLIFLIKVLLIVPESKVLYVCYLVKMGVIMSLMFSNYLENTFFSSEMLQGWLLIGVFLVHVDKERKFKAFRKNTSYALHKENILPA
jgi:hypothetical protein